MSNKIILRILAFGGFIILTLSAPSFHQAEGFYNTPADLHTLAQSSSPPPPRPAVLTEAQGKYPLGMFMDLLEDPGSKMTIDQVSSPAFASKFIPSQVETPNFSPTENAYWVRLLLVNQTRQTNKWLLEVGFANMHYVDLYTPLPGGTGFAVKQTGAMRPPSTRDILHPHIVFDLTIPPQGQQTYYLRFKNGASITLPLTLWTRNAFANMTIQDQWLTGLFFGILTGLLAYNLFLLFSLREKTYLFFVILLASVLLHQASYLGYLEVFIIPDQYYLKQFNIALFFSLWMAATVLFTDSFLEVKAQVLRLHTLNLAICAGWGGIFIESLFVSYNQMTIQALFWALISLAAVWAAGIITWRRGFQPIRFFLIAWLGMAASLFLVILVRMGISPSTMFSERLYQLGFAWMAVCWSIAQADRINLLKTETENANRKLQKSERRLSQILEGMPLGVVLYGKDQKPRYANQRTVEILNNPSEDVQPDINAERTLAQAIDYFSLQVAGIDQAYPLNNFPVISALQGVPASADDIEIDQGDRRVPLELWASPVRDDAGNVESAVLAFQDITQRRQAEAELVEYRKQLELLVNKRTAELSAANEQLHLHIEWLSAVNQINLILANSADFRQIYEKILEIINKLFAAQDSFIAEFNANSQQLKILAHSCRDNLQPELIGSVITLPDALLFPGSLEQENPIIYLKDQHSLCGPIGLHLEAAQTHTIAFVPLRLRERVFGFLGLEIQEEDRIISPNEAALLNIFSTDIAQLIGNSRLYQQSKELIAAEERARLARDLHDSVTQVLFSTTLLAEVLPEIWRRDPERGLQRLDKLRRLTRGALAEMRTMLLELRPSAVLKTPLADLLTQLTEAVTSRSALSFQLFIEQIPPLPDAVQTNFYRIAQEALNNIVKHAQALQVTMSLSTTSLPRDETGTARYKISLMIQDDGVGYASDEKGLGHMGIGIMRERAAAIQANLSLESQPGYGTQVTLIWCGETRMQND